MNRSLLWPGALALGLCLAPAAGAADAADPGLAELRAQLRDLRQQYEARLADLERRLSAAEARTAAPAPAPVAAAPTPPPAPARAAAPVGANAFNPAVSVVLQGNYANLQRDPAGYALSGFAPGGEIGPGKRGFSLAESELALAANVDDRFSANLIASISPEDTIGVEEAYAIYTAAPAGLVPKFGRFRSGIGYLNEQHPHVFDFYGAPLAYEAMLGGQYTQDGLQLKWVTPLDTFLELGAEAGGGEGFPGTARAKNGGASGALFAHVGGDIGFSHSWRAGLSWLRTGAQGREWTQADSLGDDAVVSFTGRSDLALADFVWKWAPGGNARATNFKLQGEYLRRRERGDLAYDADGALGRNAMAPYRSTQSGWYVQGVWQFMPQWRVGLRYDRLSPGTVDYGANGQWLATDGFRPKRTALMVDWTPSEFSRIRAQFARSETLPGLADDQFFLQYILSLGAHGAHRY